jgi:hypothetical protein
MSKFYGIVGYVTQSEVSPGIWDDVVVERQYRGDILQNIRKWDVTDHKNDNIAISNRISIVADPFAYENFATIRYVSWAGVRWKVNSIEIQRPRLTLVLGEIYNG